MEDKIDLRWRKSSYSGNGGGSCVELASQSGRVLVRDTQDRTGPTLAFSPAAWRKLVAEVKARHLAPSGWRGCSRCPGASPSACSGASSR